MTQRLIGRAVYSGAQLAQLGYAHARPDLSAIAWKLDGDNLAAVLDALRIARRGVVL